MARPDGQIYIRSAKHTVTPKTTDYTALDTDDYIPADPTSAAITITLQLADDRSQGESITIGNVGSSANAVTVAVQGSDTIGPESDTTDTLPSGVSIEYTPDAENNKWHRT